MARGSRKAAVVLLAPATGDGPELEALRIVSTASQRARAVPDEARIDGRRVLIEGAEEIVLQCGKASLTLRRDGKIVLRGVNVVSEADQVQRIRGGTVKIN